MDAPPHPTIRRTLVPVDATPLGVAPFGLYIGAGPDIPVFARWPGVVVHGAFPTEIGGGGETMHVRADAAAFPVRLQLLERHFAHAQTYLPANGKPFVMVMGPPGAGDLPDWDALRAFVFRDCAGIALHPGTWHEFVYPLEDDTRLHVVLRAEAHLDTLARRQHPMDARGPDLHRIDLGHLAEICLAAPSPHDGEAHA